MLSCDAVQACLFVFKDLDCGILIILVRTKLVFNIIQFLSIVKFHCNKC